MTDADNYLPNLLGASGLAIADRQRSVCEPIVAHGSAAVAAMPKPSSRADRARREAGCQVASAALR
jgi:hypothetical protein